MLKCGYASETDSLLHGGELISTVHSGMVKRETPVHTLRQCLNVQCEVASPNRSHKHEFVELELHDS